MKTQIQDACMSLRVLINFKIQKETLQKLTENDCEKKKKSPILPSQSEKVLFPPSILQSSSLSDK